MTKIWYNDITLTLTLSQPERGQYSTFVFVLRFIFYLLYIIHTYTKLEKCLGVYQKVFF